MKRRTAKFIIFIAFFLVTAHAKLAWASNSEASPTANLDYGTGIGKKLGRGLSNTAFGWLEFPKGIQDVGEQNNFIAVITWGSVYGLGRTVARTLAGAYEIVTFPVPIPKDFQPLINPEFMLGDQW